MVPIQYTLSSLSVLFCVMWGIFCFGKHVIQGQVSSPCARRPAKWGASLEEQTASSHVWIIDILLHRAVFLAFVLDVGIEGKGNERQMYLKYLSLSLSLYVKEHVCANVCVKFSLVHTGPEGAALGLGLQTSEISQSTWRYRCSGE